MLRLMTTVVIDDSPNGDDEMLTYKRVTDFRVFDPKTLRLAVRSINAGAFGRLSKRRFWLVGRYLNEDEEWVSFRARLLIKNLKTGKWEVPERLDAQVLNLSGGVFVTFHL